MASINWPDLPGPRLNSLLDGGTDPWVGDSGEVGAARRRKRFTRSLGRWKFTLLLSKPQALSLYSFYKEDLDEGVDEFNWTSPLTGETYEVRFAKRPEFQEVDGNAYEASVELEEV